MNEIIRYPVQYPLLKKYIRFFWELHIDNALLNHKIIPQRNINMRFNLSETPHCLNINNREHATEDVYFLGLQDHFTNINLKIEGRVDVLGICFYPDGFYPFLKIPVSEFKNQLLGADEIGFKIANNINARLKETGDVISRLTILENELILLINQNSSIPESFRKLFESLRNNDNSIHLAEFCIRNNISIRKLERMFNKYVGVSANTYSTLNRFHKSINQILYSNYSKMTDLAYDNGYFDQMHFIKEFKRFAGNTPKNFAQQNNSILQIGKII
ncbi:MAG TPA: AraC family transcriptional regulator [Bacteroidales bacterium]|nr:AraC family transcriptional regulator [Bacteroidales bacterium]